MEPKYMKKSEIDGAACKTGPASQGKKTFMKRLWDAVKSPVCCVPAVVLAAAVACSPQSRKINKPVAVEEIVIHVGEGEEVGSGVVPILTDMLAEGKSINQIIAMLDSQDQSGSLKLMEPEKSIREKYGIVGLVVYQLALEDWGTQYIMEQMSETEMGANEFAELVCSLEKDGFVELGDANKTVVSEYGAKGLAVYLLIDGKKNGQYIMDAVGLSETELWGMLDFMKEADLITLNYPGKKAVPLETIPAELAKTYDLSGVSLADVEIIELYASDDISVALAYAAAGEAAKAKKIANKLLKGTKDEEGDAEGAAEIFIKLKDKAGIQKCIKEIEETYGPGGSYALATLYKALYDLAGNDAEREKMKGKALEALDACAVEPAGSSGFDMGHTLGIVRLYKILGAHDKVKQIVKNSEFEFEKRNGASKFHFASDLAQLYYAAGYEEKARKLAAAIPENAKEDLAVNPGGTGKGLFELYFELGLYENALKILDDKDQSRHVSDTDRVGLYLALAGSADQNIGAALKGQYLQKALDIAGKTYPYDAGLIYAKFGMKEEAHELAETAEASGDFEDAAMLFLAIGEKKKAAGNIGMAVWKENPPKGGIYWQLKENGMETAEKGWAGPMSFGVSTEFLSEYAELSAKNGAPKDAKEIAKYLAWGEGDYESAAEIAIQTKDKERMEKLLVLDGELDAVTVAALKVALWEAANKKEDKKAALGYIQKAYGECEYDEDCAALLDLLSHFDADDAELVLTSIEAPDISQNAESFYSYSRLLRITGNAEATKDAAKKMEDAAYDLEALKTYTLAGAYEDAFRVAKGLLGDEPDLETGIAIAGLISEVEPPQGENKQDFVDALYKIANEFGEEPDSEVADVVKMYKLLGKKTDAMKYISGLKENEYWFDAAKCYAVLGMKAEALKYLKKAWNDEFGSNGTEDEEEGMSGYVD